MGRPAGTTLRTVASIAAIIGAPGAIALFLAVVVCVPFRLVALGRTLLTFGMLSLPFTIIAGLVAVAAGTVAYRQLGAVLGDGARRAVFAGVVEIVVSVAMWVMLYVGRRWFGL